MSQFYEGVDIRAMSADGCERRWKASVPFINAKSCQAPVAKGVKGVSVEEIWGVRPKRGLWAKTGLIARL